MTAGPQTLSGPAWARCRRYSRWQHDPASRWLLEPKGKKQIQSAIMMCKENLSLSIAFCKISEHFKNTVHCSLTDWLTDWHAPSLHLLKWLHKQCDDVFVYVWKDKTCYATSEQGFRCYIIHDTLTEKTVRPCWKQWGQISSKEWKVFSVITSPQYTHCVHQDTLPQWLLANNFLKIHTVAQHQGMRVESFLE